MIGRYLLTLAAALALVARAAAASPTVASPFDGRWVADLTTQAGLPIDDYLVKDGQYACRSCSPPRSYPADGRPRPVPGDADTQSESVRVAGPRAIVTHIVSAALDRTTTMTVAPDGRTATYVSLDHRPGITKTLRTVYLARRVGGAPAGAHPVSGRWQGVRYAVVPEEVRTTELRVRGGRLRYSVPVGVSYDAPIGGGFVTVNGPYGGHIAAAVKQVGARQLVETRKEDGRIVSTRSFTVSPDGRTLEVATTAVGGTTFRATSHRR